MTSSSSPSSSFRLQDACTGQQLTCHHLIVVILPVIVISIVIDGNFMMIIIRKVNISLSTSYLSSSYCCCRHIHWRYCHDDYHQEGENIVASSYVVNVTFISVDSNVMLIITRSQRRVRLKQWECMIMRLPDTLLQGDDDENHAMVIILTMMKTMIIMIRIINKFLQLFWRNWPPRRYFLRRFLQWRPSIGIKHNLIAIIIIIVVIMVIIIINQSSSC